MLKVHEDGRHATWYGLAVSDTDLGRFLSDTAVLHFYTDFNKFYGDIIFNHILCPCMRHKTTTQWNNRLLLVTKYFDSNRKN